MNSLPIFAVAAPGLERVVSDELRQHGIAARAEAGGAAWEGTYQQVLETNLHLRTATRILVRASTFRSRTFHELERHALRVPWGRFVRDGTRVRLRVTCRKSRLYHAGAVAERVLDAIEAETGVRGVPAVDDPDNEQGDAGQLFVIRLVRDVCTISADSSGDLLHRRGYREAVARAPLRETLAAAMILECGWDRRMALLDPFCGSGTLAIEAALMARNIAPGLARADRAPRQFAFTGWPIHDSAAWDETVERATAAIRTETPPAQIMASDRSSAAIRAAQANAQRAGVDHDISFEARAFASVRPPALQGCLVTNPPYGVRVGRRAEANRIVDEIEKRAAGDFAQWTVATLTASRAAGANHPGHASAPDRMPDSRVSTGVASNNDAGFTTRNGGIPVVFTVRASAIATD